MEQDSPAEEGDPRWLISALADGEGDAAGIAGGCAAWARCDVEARRSWHVYHLIGDVLRSDDLASVPARDQAFLERLHARLANEPVPSAAAPQPVDAGADPRPRKAWQWPAALAASVIALAAGLVLMLDPAGRSGSDAARRFAVAPDANRVAATGSGAGSLLVPETVDQGSRVVRDARLDRYLRAHREYGAALPGSLPGGASRSVSTVSYER